MVKEIMLNDTVIHVEQYIEENVQGLRKITVHFQVTSEEYHDIATLLYERTFDVKIPEQNVAFRGAIQEYATSITNLYNPGQVGEYRLSLLEISSEGKG